MAEAAEQKGTTVAGGPLADPGLRAWVDYLRDMGILDLYARQDGAAQLTEEVRARLLTRQSASAVPSQQSPMARTDASAKLPVAKQTVQRPTPPTVAASPASGRQPPSPAPARGGWQAASGGPDPGARSPELTRNYFSTDLESTTALPPELAAPMPKPNPLEALFPQPALLPLPEERGAALERVRAEIGDCTRCSLAYAGRHTIVFGEGDANADLMFVGEGPGADEDASGRPFIGKAGQLLTNMIGAMGLTREQVYIANVVKCRPPGNRAPEFPEATTCSQFLLQQIDIVRPKVIVALGSTAATYLLGVRQSLATLRGQWMQCRGAKVAVTYHPAFLLRDPRQKPEAWKDLQRVMAELGLRPAARS